MKQLIFVLLFICGVVCAHGGFRPIKFRNCKSEFEVLSVEASDCDSDDSNKCPFKRNTEPTIRIGFKPNRNVNSLKANVRAKLEGGADSKSFVSFALENENACQGSNITCPLVEGKTYFYSQSVKVAKEYPLVDVQVNWLITDPENSDSSKREICIIFLAKSGNTLMMLFLCTLSAQILIYGESDNPMKLWDDFKEDLAEDFIRKRQRNGDYSREEAIKKAYRIIAHKLDTEATEGRKFQYWVRHLGMDPVDCFEEEGQMEEIVTDEALFKREEKYIMLNEEERTIVDAIMESIQDGNTQPRYI